MFRFRGPGRRALASWLLGVILCASQVATAVAAGGPYSGVKSTSCTDWGSGAWRQTLFSVSGFYVVNYQWNDPTASVWVSACGPAAPYGSYRVSSKKQITTKYWINVKDLSSCTAGAPLNFQCTATATTTTMTYKTAAVTKVDPLTLRVSQVWFIDAPAGHSAFMRLEGSNTLLGDTDIRVFTAQMQ
jgi:hypothetical protein